MDSSTPPRDDDEALPNFATLPPPNDVNDQETRIGDLSKLTLDELRIAADEPGEEESTVIRDSRVDLEEIERGALAAAAAPAAEIASSPDGRVEDYSDLEVVEEHSIDVPEPVKTKAAVVAPRQPIYVGGGWLIAAGLACALVAAGVALLR